MKRLSVYMSSLAMLTLAACSDEPGAGYKDGKLFIEPSYIGEVIVKPVEGRPTSRAGEVVPETEYTYTQESLEKSTIIWISNGEGVVRKFKDLSTYPTGGERLAGGIYVAEAWAGDSVSASWSARYYKAAQEFAINGDARVDLELKLANVFASVVIDKSIDLVLLDYSVTISHSRGSRTFEGKESRVASFMMPTNREAGPDDPVKENKLKWKITGRTYSNINYEKEGVIDYVMPGHQYILSFSHNGGTPSVGGALIGLEIKDVDLVTNQLYVVQPPTIRKSDQSPMTRPIIVPRGKQADPVRIEVGAIGRVTTAQLQGSLMSQILDDGNSIDFIAASKTTPELIKRVEDKGLVWTGGKNGGAGGQDDVFYDETKNLTSMKFTFTPEFINTLPVGTYDVNMTIIDDGSGEMSDKPEQRTSRAVLTIVVSEEVVVVNIPDIDEYSLPEKRNVTPTSVKLYGEITDATAELTGVGLEYRVKFAENWTRVSPEPAANRATGGYTFIVDGLQPNTTIEYRTVWTKAGEGTESFSGIKEITTATNAIPNGGFEDWNTSTKAFLLYNTTEMFWDSGNKGSSTMSKNVTVPDQNIKHSGNYSAKLQSQFVGIGAIGRFAAGNAFVGEYLETAGTDGVLGWGRPFYYKPKGLKGFIKYTPGTVEYTHKDAPDIVKGQPDKGIIYIALLTDDMNAQGDNSNANRTKYPVVVRTKDAHLFDKNGSNVIAYGELVLDQATEGNGMIEFNIPLEYYESMKNQDVYYLLLVCSASKGGDYFAGGDSVMYLDDFELVY